MKFLKTSKLAVTTFACAGLLFAGNVKAQKAGYDSQGFRFGIGAEAGLPTGNMRNYSHFSLGGSARLQYDLKGPVSLMLTSGYTNFFARNYTLANNIKTDYKDYGLIPVKAGIKIFPSHNFYISGEAGAGFETNNNPFNGYDKSTKLILSPGIGFAESHSGLDLGLRYENYSGGNSNNYGIVALRIAYGFGGL